MSEEWAPDWEGMRLPIFVQPPKPAGFEGDRALEIIALRPSTHPERVFLTTNKLVNIYVYTYLSKSR